MDTAFIVSHLLVYPGGSSVRFPGPHFLLLFLVCLALDLVSFFLILEL